MSIVLEPPSLERRAEFLLAARRSRELHRGYVVAPSTAKTYAAYLERVQAPSNDGYLVQDAQSSALVGVINLNEIVLGNFKSAYLGYYAFVPYAGLGYMSLGLSVVLHKAFSELRLHRLEANIQPSNGPSIRLVKKLGFRREGFSPRYLKVAGRWRDHERWSLLADEWHEARR